MTSGKLGRPFLDAVKEFLDAPFGIDINHLLSNFILAAALLISFAHWLVVFVF